MPKHPPLVIDARGHKCPVPTLRLRKAMADSAISSVCLLADDPMAQIDVPYFCSQNNYMLKTVENEGEHWRFVVER